MKIFNMTQHSLQVSQVAQAEQLGYSFIESERLTEIKKLLSNLSGNEDLEQLSKELLLACVYEQVEALIFPIGSPLFYMEFSKVYNTLAGGKFPKLLFSHTMRESVETVQADGSITKTMTFNHKGYHVLAPNKVPVYHAL